VCSFDRTTHFNDYLQEFLDAGICLVFFTSGIPRCTNKLHQLLIDLDANHTIIWFTCDFGFLPDVEVGYPLVTIKNLMYGNFLITPANGGIQDCSITQDSSID